MPTSSPPRRRTAPHLLDRITAASVPLIVMVGAALAQQQGAGA